MNGGFSNEIVGGAAALIRAAVKSPEFQHLVQGWSINKDGSAEFNDLTVRGTFDGNDFILNGTGLFIYSGTPALGNLVLALASAPGADQFGNSYSGPGISVSAPGGTRNEIMIRSDLNAMLIYAG